jgi:LDH2 family malate/lactate/ureidoglycolate dehydrogenase
MATSVMTFNKIRQLKDEGLRAPAGVGADREGIETVEPSEIAMLLPIGSYKGYGISMVVEILCSLLTGMPYGPHIPKMFEAPMNAKRHLGHFVTATRIDCFQDLGLFRKRLSKMMNEIRREPRLDKDVPIQVAGDPEKRIARERNKHGIPLMPNEMKALSAIGLEYGMSLNVKRR